MTSEEPTEVPGRVNADPRVRDVFDRFAAALPDDDAERIRRLGDAFAAGIDVAGTPPGGDVPGAARPAAVGQSSAGRG